MIRISVDRGPDGCDGVVHVVSPGGMARSIFGR
jgi:hypothetical protein